MGREKIDEGSNARRQESVGRVDKSIGKFFLRDSRGTRIKAELFPVFDAH